MNELVELIVEQITPGIPLNVDLWDSKRCAQLFKKTPKYFTEYIASNPDFPKAVRVPTIKGRSNPLWRAREVIKWAEKY